MCFIISGSLEKKQQRHSVKRLYEYVRMTVLAIVIIVYYSLCVSGAYDVESLIC